MSMSRSPKNGGNDQCTASNLTKDLCALPTTLEAVDGIACAIDREKNLQSAALLADEGLRMLHQCSQEQLDTATCPYREFFVSTILRDVCMKTYDMLVGQHARDEALPDWNKIGASAAWDIIEPYATLIERADFTKLEKLYRKDESNAESDIEVMRSMLQKVRSAFIESAEEAIDEALLSKTPDELELNIRIAKAAIDAFKKDDRMISKVGMWHKQVENLDAIMTVFVTIEWGSVRANMMDDTGGFLREVARARSYFVDLKKDIPDCPVFQTIEPVLERFYEDVKKIPNTCFHELWKAVQELNHALSSSTDPVHDRQFRKAATDVLRLYHLIEECMPHRYRLLKDVRLIAVLELCRECEEKLESIPERTLEIAPVALATLTAIRDKYQEAMQLIFRSPEELAQASKRIRAVLNAIPVGNDIASAIRECEELLRKEGGGGD